MGDLAIEEKGSAKSPAAEHGVLGRRLLLRILVLCAAYYAGVALGFLFIFPSSYISVMWLPNTFMVAALVLSAPRHWAWLLLIVFPVHLLAHAQQDVTMVHATLYYVFDCAIVLTMAGALRRYGLNDFALDDFKQATRYVAVATAAAGAGSLVWSPLIVSLWRGGDLWSQWGLIFLCNLLPFLIALPCIVIALTRGRQIVRNASSAELAEFSLLLLGLVVCGMGVFGLQARMAGHPAALAYAPLPFLLWAAVRFGPLRLSFSYFVFTLIAISYTLAGHGPFIAQTPGQVVLWLQIFLLALYVPLLVLASLVEERRAKGAELAESEARYRSIVEDQTELICRFLPDGTYTFVNGAYCRYFQRAPEELLGKTFWSFIPQEWHTPARAHLAALTPEQPVATIEHEVVAPSGEIRWQQWRDRGFFDARGRLVDYQAVGRDITDRKRAEQAMQNLAHAARLAVVGELTGSIAHEINQPLGAILSNAEAAEMLLESPTPPMDEVRNILADIRKDDLRASEVIRRVRGLLRKREPQMTPLTLNEVVLEVIHLVSADAQQRKVELSCQYATDLPAVRGDRVHLQQVLLNLIMNGLDAMGDTPEQLRRIVVHTERDGETAQVRVVDSGPGIAPDKLTAAFDSFFTTKEHGMGLGLSIARSIVELHGGLIWASNNVDRGATLTFKLPIATAAEELHHSTGTE
jgi:two-component system, LuxR family, sensor kinase FixL